MDKPRKAWKMSFKGRFKGVLAAVWLASSSKHLAWSMEGLPRRHVAFLCMVDASHFYTAAWRVESSKGIFRLETLDIQ